MNMRELVEDQKITYADFDRQINKTASSLWHSRIRKEDRFAVMLPNCPEFLWYLEFRTDFPRSSIGKIQKEALKAEEKDTTKGCYDWKQA